MGVKTSLVVGAQHDVCHTGVHFSSLQLNVKRDTKEQETFTKDYFDDSNFNMLITFWGKIGIEYH